MWTASFWRATAERSISTGAQTALALAGTDALGWLALDWGQIGAASGIAVGLAVLKSLAAGAKDGNPSLTNAEVTPEVDHTPPPADWSPRHRAD